MLILTSAAMILPHNALNESCKTSYSTTYPVYTRPKAYWATQHMYLLLLFSSWLRSPLLLQGTMFCVPFQVLVTVRFHTVVFWVVTPYILVHGN